MDAKAVFKINQSRETQCVRCSYSLIQRDFQQALTRVYCRPLQEDIHTVVTNCSKFCSKAEAEASSQLSDQAAILYVDSTVEPPQYSWQKEYKTIRANGEWARDRRKRRKVRSTRNPIGKELVQ